VCTRLVWRFRSLDRVNVLPHSSQLSPRFPPRRQSFHSARICSWVSGDQENVSTAQSWRLTSSFSSSLINWSLPQNIEMNYINKTLDIILIFSLNQTYKIFSRCCCAIFFQVIFFTKNFTKLQLSVVKCRTMLTTRRLSILYRRSLNQTTNHSKPRLIPLLYHTRGGTLKNTYWASFAWSCLNTPAWRQYLPDPARVTSLRTLICAAPLITCIYNDAPPWIFNDAPHLRRHAPPQKSGSNCTYYTILSHFVQRKQNRA
jgi:hypothetical protein